MVQLTDTPIFAIFREVSVNSQMSVKFQNFENGVFRPKSYENKRNFGEQNSIDI